MVDLQELITRGRLLMNTAPSRLEVFKLVNGKRNTAEIAKLAKKHVNNTRRDLTKLADAELIRIKVSQGEEVYKDKLPVYEKVPLGRTISVKYFEGGSVGIKKTPTNSLKPHQIKQEKKYKPLEPLPIPVETQLLDIISEGEDQKYEFKASGTKTEKLTKEIAAMLNTTTGGIVFYGVDDDGRVRGSDVSAQELDQRVQNAIRTTIKPRAVVKLKRIKVLGSEVIAILVPPWNGKALYQLNDSFFIRHGSNCFPMSGDEIKQLLTGKPIV